jgi:hypothetical protein
MLSSELLNYGGPFGNFRSFASGGDAEEVLKTALTLVGITSIF